MIARRHALAAALGVSIAACSVPDPSAVVALDAPPQDGFPYVAELVELRCGTLDCHGSSYRNMRIYGDEGLRYSASDQPCQPTQTTTVEVAQDYASIVGLEPEEMSAVVSSGGSDPERLSFIAKPLGIESHMGGTIFQMGDDTYACLTSWLAGKVETASCLAAMPPTVCSEPASDSIEVADAGLEAIVRVDAGRRDAPTDAVDAPIDVFDPPIDVFDVTVPADAPIDRADVISDASPQ